MWDAVRAGLGEMGNDLVFTKELSLGVWGVVIPCLLVPLFFFRGHANSIT